MPPQTDHSFRSSVATILCAPQVGWAAGAHGGDASKEGGARLPAQAALQLLDLHERLVGAGYVGTPPHHHPGLAAL